MPVATQNILAFGSLFLAAVCLVYAVSNPYRLRRVSREAISSIIPSSRREQLLTLTDAWAGRSRMSDFQLQVISLGGLIIGLLAGLALGTILGTLYGLLISAVLAVLLWYFPKQRFLRGFPKQMIQQLEREAPIISSFMHRAIGITGLSVQRSFEQFMEIYPEKQTVTLLRQIPEGIPYPDALLGLNLPVNELSNWLQLVQTLSSISDFGNPENILREVRDRIRKREEQYLRMIIKRKAFAAPAATVVIMLPGLMCVLIGSVLLQAIRTLTGGF